MQKQHTKNTKKNARSFEDHAKDLHENDVDEFEQAPQKKFKKKDGELKKPHNKKEYTQKRAKSEEGGEKKKGGDVVKFGKLNKLYNELMMKEAAKNRPKKAIVEDILRNTSGVLTKIVMKHDGCRIVQGILKYGDENQKKSIVTTFLHKDLVVELAKSKYGHFLLIKMAASLDKKQLNSVLEILMKNFDIIGALPEGAKTIAAYLKAGANRSIVDEFLKPIINIKMENAETHEKLENTALKIAERKAFGYPIQQQIMAESLRVLIPDERAKIIETVNNNFNTFITTKEGVTLICNVIDYLDSKDKKQLLKNLKPNVKQYLTVENSLFHVVIIKILASVDDTVLVRKTILNEISKDLEELIKSPHVTDIFLAIFEDEEEYLSKFVTKSSAAANTKKDKETRKAELIKYTFDSLVNVISFNIAEYIANPKQSKLLSHIIKTILNDNIEDQFTIVSTTIDIIIENYNKSDKSKDLEHKVLISDPNGHRLVKSIVAGYQNYNGDAKEFYGEIIEKIYEFVVSELPVLLGTKAIFVIIALIENTEYKDQIIQEINQNKHLLKNLKGAGLDILKKLL